MVFQAYDKDTVFDDLLGSTDPILLSELIKDRKKKVYAEYAINLREKNKNNAGKVYIKTEYVPGEVLY